MISTSIKLDGEQEFKKQLGDVNSGLKTLQSDLKLTTAEFKGQANSLDALEAKDRILNDLKEQQAEKVRTLEKALQDVGEVYKDQPKKIDEYKRSLNNAKAELLKLEDELKDNAKYMKEARDSTDKTAKSIDEFGKAVQKAEDGGGSGGLQSFVDALGDLKGAVMGGVIVGGVSAAAGAILEVVDATEEYRKVMGSLETSSQRAGYTADETAETFGRLFSVMGDYDAAKEATVQLQSLGLSQEKLNVLTDQTIGAWTALGGAAPIETLAESIAQTISAGEATGAFSDILVNAGLSEDYFNERLGECNTKTERANQVMDTLAKEGMAELGQGWIDLNDDIVKTNEAQAKYDEAQARLADTVLPAKIWLTELATEGWDVLNNSIQTVIDLWNKAVDLFNKEKDLRQNGFFVSEKDRMAAYGYEAYYTEDGLLRYREAGTTGALAGSNVSEGRAATAQDLENAVNAASYRSAGETHRSGSATVVMELDGLEVGRAIVPYVNEENRANPEVVSDPL